MKKSMMTGIAVASFSVAMSFSGQAAAQPFGYCGPENQGQVKSLTYYHHTGMVSRYYEFTCYGSQWENTYFLSCDGQGYCTNLT